MRNHKGGNLPSLEIREDFLEEGLGKAGKGHEKRREMRTILLCPGNYREFVESSRLESRMGRKLWWNERTLG